MYICNTIQPNGFALLNASMLALGKKVRWMFIAWLIGRISPACVRFSGASPVSVVVARPVALLVAFIDDRLQLKTYSLCDKEEMKREENERAGDQSWRSDTDNAFPY